MIGNSKTDKIMLWLLGNISLIFFTGATTLCESWSAQWFCNSKLFWRTRDYTLSGSLPFDLYDLDGTTRSLYSHQHSCLVTGIRRPLLHDKVVVLKKDVCHRWQFGCAYRVHPSTTDEQCAQDCWPYLATTGDEFIKVYREHFHTIAFCPLQNVETSTGESSSSVSSGQAQLELSFEYLMSKDKLQWITIASEQAILMSVCLQAMVDELLLKKTGMKRKQVSY